MPHQMDQFAGLTAAALQPFHDGSDTECWKLLGAHLASVGKGKKAVTGTRFAVWAPDAQRVWVKGDFNDWQFAEMQLVPGTGIWAIFVPGVTAGAIYKYEIIGADGVQREKFDPMARLAEQWPSNASVVIGDTQYRWGDRKWLKDRAGFVSHESPMAIYEVHLGSWRAGLGYEELATQLVDYVKAMGYTHVEFMPIAEHPLVKSWGYQVTNYFAPTSRLGHPDQLRHLIDALHQAGIGVILDWVPGHFPKDDWALGRFDGTALYEHPDWRKGEHKEWGTYVFNYARYEVRSFLLSNALYWIEEFHFDALRVDAVASMVYLDYNREHGNWEPNMHGGNEYLEAIELLRDVNRALHERHPGVVTVAEESTAFNGVTKPVSEGGLGFDFKWNMGWMNDTLRYLALDPIHRQYQHHDMTFAMLYAYTEHYILPISHDEVVHGKQSMLHKTGQDTWRQFANLRAYYSFMWGFPGKKLLFMGCDFGVRPEWNEAASLEWDVLGLEGHRGIAALIRDLNSLYRAHPALWALDSDWRGFTWINNHDAGSNVFSWVRSDGAGEQIAVIANFSPQPYTAHRIGLPSKGKWQEIFNSDAAEYDGTGQFTNHKLKATDQEWDGQPASADLVVPPLGTVFLRKKG